jgi:hypothetical protein
VAYLTDADESVRDLAHRIPEIALAEMSPVELGVRLRYVLDLEAEAEAKPDRAVNIRRRAEKVIKAMSPASYSAELGRLEGALADAHRRGSANEARAMLAGIEQLKRAHPQPDARLYLEAAMAGATRELDRRLTIPGPEPAAKSAISRRFGHKPRKGRR